MAVFVLQSHLWAIVETKCEIQTVLPEIKVLRILGRLTSYTELTPYLKVLLINWMQVSWSDPFLLIN